MAIFPVSHGQSHCAGGRKVEVQLGADFREVDLDSNFSIFGVRRFTEWPGPLHWIAFPVEILTKRLIHWIPAPFSLKTPFFSLKSASSDPLPQKSAPKTWCSFRHFLDCLDMFSIFGHGSLFLGCPAIRPLLRNTPVTPAPCIQGKNMNKKLDKICPQMLQNKANSAIWGPYFWSYFALYVVVGVSKRIPNYNTSLPLELNAPPYLELKPEKTALEVKPTPQQV